MTKKFVDQFIQNMKRAGMVTKASPWLVEGIGNQHMNVRYVGVTIKDDWIEILSPNNNLLVKFIIDKNNAFLEFYLANKAPFLKFMHVPFQESNKWEKVFGEIKRVLKRDKNDFLNHRDMLGNLYTKIKSSLIS